MAKCKDIIGFIEKLAPTNLAEDWDNVGLMVGDLEAEVKTILVALDINDEVIDEAITKNADMIITHHPFIFGSIKKINSESAVGRRSIKLIKNGIAVYSAHTNLDIAKNGTNDVLANLIGISNRDFLIVTGENNGLGRVGELGEPIKFIDFARDLKNKLGMKNVTITGDTEKVIKKIGLCTGQGSGSEYMAKAKELGCDAYVTGDLRYHEAQYANNIDLCVVDITHYESEVLIVPVLCEYLDNCSKQNNFDFKCLDSEVNAQTLNII